VLLGLIFLASGTLKLRDPSWPDAAAALAVPPMLVGLVAPMEIVLGAVVVAGLGSPIGAAAALVVLLAFTAMLLQVLARPAAARPVCACFGRWSSRPVDRWSVVRNLGFIALAVVALDA
jgi:uncharacterized membrane protein YphA (DoxX/SURF4 family)